MALQGTAFITMWHDVDPPMLGEFNAWHTHEHMAERVGIPGFLGGRRYWNHGLDRQSCFTMYEGEDADAFRSPAYLERLNSPTPWTTRVQPAFRNFLRIACDTVFSEGQGIGGAVGTWRLSLAQSAVLDLEALAGGLRQERAVLGIHIGRARPDITAYRTAETELRPAGEEAGFDAVVIAEGVGTAELETLLARQAERLGAMPGVVAVQPATYDLSFRIAKMDLV
jgi:hypothetical protein